MFYYLYELILITVIVYIINYCVHGLIIIKAALNAPKPAPEVETLLNHYDELECMMKTHTVLTYDQNYAKINLFLSNKMISLHRCSLMSDQQLQCLLVDKVYPAKSKALYQYLRPQSKVELSKDEEQRAPALLLKMIKLQKQFSQSITAKNWTTLKQFLASLSPLDRVVINWINTDLTKADLDGVSLDNMNILMANFNFASLRKANFSYSYLQFVNFNGAVLLGVVWDNAKLSSAKMSCKGAQIDQATYQFINKYGYRDFTEVQFIGDFNTMDFNDLLLTNAEFRDGKVTDCYFYRTNFHGIRFKSDLVRPQVKEPYYSPHAIMARIEEKILLLWSKTDEKSRLLAKELSLQYSKILSYFHQKQLTPALLTEQHWLMSSQRLAVKEIEELVEPDFGTKAKVFFTKLFQIEEDKPQAIDPRTRVVWPDPRKSEPRPGGGQ